MTSSRTERLSPMIETFGALAVSPWFFLAETFPQDSEVTEITYRLFLGSVVMCVCSAGAGVRWSENQVSFCAKDITDCVLGAIPSKTENVSAIFAAIGKHFGTWRMSWRRWYVCKQGMLKPINDTPAAAEPKAKAKAKAKAKSKIAVAVQEPDAVEEPDTDMQTEFVHTKPDLFSLLLETRDVFSSGTPAQRTVRATKLHTALKVLIGGDMADYRHLCDASAEPVAADHAAVLPPAVLPPAGPPAGAGGQLLPPAVLPPAVLPPAGPPAGVLPPAGPPVGQAAGVVLPPAVLPPAAGGPADAVGHAQPR